MLSKTMEVHLEFDTHGIRLPCICEFRDRDLAFQEATVSLEDALEFFRVNAFNVHVVSIILAAIRVVARRVECSAYGRR